MKCKNKDCDATVHPNPTDLNSELCDKCACSVMDDIFGHCDCFECIIWREETEENPDARRPTHMNFGADQWDNEEDEDG